MGEFYLDETFWGIDFLNSDELALKLIWQGESRSTKILSIAIWSISYQLDPQWQDTITIKIEIQIQIQIQIQKKKKKKRL